MQTQFKIAIGCDLAGYDLEQKVYTRMKEMGYDITHVGCDSSHEGNYTVYAKKVGDLVSSGEVDKGILICGTGQGMAIAANKVRNIRCALVYDVFPAIMSREHNNSNVMATGAWMVTPDKAIDIIEAWLFGKYSEGRHDVRIAELKEIENERFK